MSMKDWEERLDKFLEFFEYEILQGNGDVSRKKVNDFIEIEYEQFKPIQDKIFQSDYNRFEKETQELIK